MDRREGPGPAGADPFSLLGALAAFALFAAFGLLTAFALLAAFALFAAFRLLAARALLAAGWTGSSLAGAGGSGVGVWLGVVHALVPGDGRLTRFGRG